MAQWNIGLWDHLLRRRDGSGSDRPRLADVGAEWRRHQHGAHAAAGHRVSQRQAIDAEAVKATFEAITNVDLSNNRVLANVYLDSIEVTDNRTVVFNHPRESRCPSSLPMLTMSGSTPEIW